MKIFVSWSKVPAKSIAVELKHFLEMTLRTVEVWVSDSDLQKGKRWGPQLAQELESTNVGIICVTPNNMQEPWLHFEAGALSKSMADAAIHPLCLSVDKSQLPSTLSQFQATVFEKEDFLGLVIAINNAGGAPEKESGVRERFERGWEGLEGAVSKALYAAIPVRDDAVKYIPAWAAVPETDEPDEPAFSEDEHKLIKLLAEHGALAPAALLRLLNASETRVGHYLDNLEGYVYLLPNYGDDLVSLTKEGRALAVKKGFA
jgi:hypothetical protein